jgi:hypothetical protein
VVLGVIAVGWERRADKLGPLFEAGKTQTKIWFDTLPAPQRRKLTKRLLKLRQNDLILYLTLGVR